ncbi:MAG: hypothetical protein QG608_2578 [Actinomycetota bacterium]|nr:hypothetical protein [Actinomycetota bacterium]
MVSARRPQKEGDNPVETPVDIGKQPHPPTGRPGVPPATGGPPTGRAGFSARRLIADPVWRVRAALAVIALWAATVYAWGITQVSLHEYYAPAVKSMSVSWRAWFYGGYDPDASITLDKLPGAFMIQALSVRVFGYHTWSVILPQVLAAVLSVLVLFRLVRRWQGPAAGLLAAAFLATTPILAALAHSQISDGILILFLVLAADAGSRALESGRLQPLLLCALWIGLAFQTKMAQAWGIVPAIGLAYLFVAPGRLRLRALRAGAAGLLCLAVSLWQVILFALTPVGSRPYADGSTDNSLLSMIFEYNLSSRFDTGSAGGAAGGGGPSDGGGPGGSSDWLYMLGDSIASQVGWVYPLAVAGLVLGLVGWRSQRRGGTGRADAVRGTYLLWGLWLAVHAGAFSTGRVAHEFYVVAVAPPLAALAAAGAVRLWKLFRSESRTRWFAPGVLVVELAWTVYLCGHFSDFRPWLRPAVLAIGALALILLVLPSVLRGRAPRWSLATGAALSVTGILLAPATWAASTADPDYVGSSRAPTAGPAGNGLGGRGQFPGGRGDGLPTAGTRNGQTPPDGQGSTDGQAGTTDGQSTTDGQTGAGGQGSTGGQPGQNGQMPEGGTPPSGGGGPGGGMTDTSRVQPLVDYLNKQRNGEKYAAAVQGSSSAGSFILAGLDVLPMGGFSGSIPFPSSDYLAELVEAGKVRFVVLGGGMGGPGPSGTGREATTDLQTWVTEQCTAVDSGEYQDSTDEESSPQEGSSSQGQAQTPDQAQGTGDRDAGGSSSQSLYDCKASS